jgi:hypothetical protein
MPTGFQGNPAIVRRMPLSAFRRFVFIAGKNLPFQATREYVISSLQIATFSAYIARTTRSVVTQTIMRIAEWN